MTNADFLLRTRVRDWVAGCRAFPIMSIMLSQHIARVGFEQATQIRACVSRCQTFPMIIYHNYGASSVKATLFRAWVSCYLRFPIMSSEHAKCVDFEHVTVRFELGLFDDKEVFQLCYHFAGMHSFQAGDANSSHTNTVFFLLHLSTGMFAWRWCVQCYVWWMVEGVVSVADRSGNCALDGFTGAIRTTILVLEGELDVETVVQKLQASMALP